MKQISDFDEYELLTLREGLFCFKKHYWESLSDEDFEQIDTKIKTKLKELKNG